MGWGGRDGIGTCDFAHNRQCNFSTGGAGTAVGARARAGGRTIRLQAAARLGPVAPGRAGVGRAATGPLWAPCGGYPFQTPHPATDATTPLLHSQRAHNANRPIASDVAVACGSRSAVGVQLPVPCSNPAFPLSDPFAKMNFMTKPLLARSWVDTGRRCGVAG